MGPSARPTYDNIRDMKYLRAVINGELLLNFSMCKLPITDCVMKKLCAYFHLCKLVSFCIGSDWIT